MKIDNYKLIDYTDGGEEVQLKDSNLRLPWVADLSDFYFWEIRLKELGVPYAIAARKKHKGEVYGLFTEEEFGNFSNETV